MHRAATIKASGAPCALCGRPIDYTIPHFYLGADGRKHVHPASFVVDEIVPIKYGGSPTDESNTQAAHYACNAVRGARLMSWVNSPQGRAALADALPKAMQKLNRQKFVSVDIETSVSL